MFTPRLLSRVISTSVSPSSSVLAFAPEHAAATLSVSASFGSLSSSTPTTAVASAANSHRWLSSSLLSSSYCSSSSSSLLLFRRSFSSSSPVIPSPSTGSDASTKVNASVSNPEIQTLLNRTEIDESTTNAIESATPIASRLSASQYAEHLKLLEELKPNLSNIQKAVNFLTPNRADPTVNNAILELYSEAFESNWTEQQRKEVGAYLEQEYFKGGDAALVVAINKLLEKRVTLRGIIDSVGGWYPILGLATVIAISKELIIVNEELLMVTNFLTVFTGLYLALADTVVESHKANTAALGKKFYEHRQLQIDVSKALLSAYEKNPKVVSLLEELKADINRLITQRSRAAYLKKKAEIQNRFLKSLDQLVQAEAQAEGNLRRQILERFGDYMEFQLALKRLKPESFFQDTMVSALAQLISGQPMKAAQTPTGQLVKEYIEGALWTVDWKNLPATEWDLKYLGLEPILKWIKAVDSIQKAQDVELAKWKKENPKGTEEQFYEAHGGKESLQNFLRRQLETNPQQFKDALAAAQKEQEEWKQEVEKVLAKVAENKKNEKAQAQAQAQAQAEAAKTETKQTGADMEKYNRLKEELANAEKIGKQIAQMIPGYK